jgi:hypothetical protein
MEEMEHLVAQVKQLTEQVKALAETSTIQTARQEQLFKMQEERLNILPQLAEQLQHAIDELETTDEALKESLDDQDAAVDDLKKAIAALLLIQQQQNAQKVQSTQP